MARSVILGNNGLTVGLNESGLVHDFYYPYVGLENLTTARSHPHYVGIWVDGEFSWIHQDDWQKDVNFNDDALVSNITMTHERLQIGIHFQDFVDVNNDIFARKLRVRNLSNQKRDVRVFFHQIFQISADGRADTALYVPEDNYILDYKGRCSILAYAEVVGGEPMDQYAVGNAGIEGKEGTFRDAEDGELSMSAVEHAGVDSTLRVSFSLESSESRVVHYWLAVADTQNNLETLHKTMLGGGFDVRLQATLRHWHDWLEPAYAKIGNLSISEEYRTALLKSLLVISAHTDSHGGIIASCDSSIYNYGRDYYSYVWPRDGAYVMWPLIRLGYTKEPKKFFNFCRSIMHPDGYLMHKYQPDRAIGSTWHPLIHGNSKELAIQEDETALVIFMLGEYAKFSGDTEYVQSLFKDFIKPCAQFMQRFIDESTGLPHASYDLWEEKFLTNTYTTAITAAALDVAATVARSLGEDTDAASWSQAAQLLRSNAKTFYNQERKLLNKGYLLQKDNTLHMDTVLDISTFFGAYRFNYAHPKYIQDTLHAIESQLLDISPSGGTARYEDDNYFRSTPAYKGNPWYVTTLWMAQFYAQNGAKDKANHYITWSLGNTTQSGLLSEQITPQDSQIVGVTPLVWSHAELINTILDVSDNK